jgi:hypothetical protein
LRHLRHQELWRAVGTHYGPTRIYGPTGHAIGGTAQQALLSFYRSYRSQASAVARRLGTISDDYEPAATCRSMDLAAAAGARATRMSRLWAGDAAGGRGPERRRATGPTTTRPPGAGRRVSPGKPLILFRRAQPDRFRGEHNSNQHRRFFVVTILLGRSLRV